MSVTYSQKKYRCIWEKGGEGRGREGREGTMITQMWPNINFGGIWVKEYRHSLFWTTILI